jgi:hypothetical protein
MIRIATACLSKRIFAGHPLKSGLGFREPRHDVTDDVYQAIKDHVGIGNQITLRGDGEPGFIIQVLPLQHDPST